MKTRACPEGKRFLNGGGQTQRSILLGVVTTPSLIPQVRILPRPLGNQPKEGTMFVPIASTVAVLCVCGLWALCIWVGIQALNRDRKEK